ncbi:MAG TPA: DUF3079 domain-containing protein [Polyangiaceae bacterium]|nr:DUF3079 domain-containing protein [Polyangiaceae bacterium]
MKHFPEKPSHPERICWGCERLCSDKDLACGNGTERTQHPIELFGDDWRSWFNEQLLESKSHG